MTPPKPPRKNPPKPEIAITQAPPNVDSESVVIRVKHHSFQCLLNFFKYSILNCRMNLTAPPNRTEKSPCSTKNRFAVK